MVESNILEMRQICKHFPGVQALAGVDFCVRKGEIHALVGHNGAGKSTLLKILSGIYKPDSGQILFDKDTITDWSPREVLDHGISFIYQELNLVQDMTVAQNIYLGREPRNRLGFINWLKMQKNAKAALQQIGEKDIHVKVKLQKLSVAQQQMVAIAKALDQKPQLLVLDEPTSRLSQTEIEKLFEVLKALSEKDISIIYVSHRLDEIYRIAERVTVIRDGNVVGTHDTRKIKPAELIHEMIGDKVRKVENATPPPRNSAICLKVNDLKGPKVNGISFELHQKEVLGITGAVGAGKTEFIHLLFGLEKPTSGEIEMNGNKMRFVSSQDAIKGGLALCPEDRKAQGLILENTIERNISLVALKKLTKGGWLLSGKQENSHARKMVDSLKIIAPSVRQLARYLSGGNQQKVVLAKWLSTDSKVFLFDEPTVGVDVHGKTEIYDLLKKLASEGSGVIFVTSDPEEAWSVCSRVLVIFEGKTTANIDPKKTSLNQLMHYVMGGK